MRTQTEIFESVIGAAMVAAAFVFLVYGAKIVGWPGSLPETLPLRASFLNAEGIRTGSEVRIAGISVGQVEWLALNPVTFQAEAELGIKKALEVPNDSRARVSREGLLGATFVEILPGQSPVALDAGDNIRTSSEGRGVVDLLLDGLGALEGRR
ncbi:MAG: MlaD family protein [Maritimibacter sp.]